MSESQFKAQADTGDILLFHGSMALTKLTRTVTNSYFDHVAMVLKFETEPDEIFLVEAVGGLGVTLNRWSFLRDSIGYGKFYKRMIFRHVNFDRGEKMVDNLEKLLSEAVGKKYGISSNKLTRAKTRKIVDDVDGAEEQKNLIADDRTFFCSELVAKAFKLLYIIEDDERSCASFYPSHFSAKKDDYLKLTPGTSIDSEMQVIVEQEDMYQNLVEYLPEDQD